MGRVGGITQRSDCRPGRCRRLRREPVEDDAGEIVHPGVESPEGVAENRLCGHLSLGISRPRQGGGWRGVQERATCRWFRGRWRVSTRQAGRRGWWPARASRDAGRSYRPDLDGTRPGIEVVQSRAQLVPHDRDLHREPPHPRRSRWPVSAVPVRTMVTTRVRVSLMRDGDTTATGARGRGDERRFPAPHQQLHRPARGSGDRGHLYERTPPGERGSRRRDLAADGTNHAAHVSAPGVEVLPGGVAALRGGLLHGGRESRGLVQVIPASVSARAIARSEIDGLRPNECGEPS